ncbi:MAG: helix-hairpin-helix domain-containing protein [Siphonobacter sp.]
MKVRFLVFLFPLYCWAQEPVRPELDAAALTQHLLPNQSENVSDEVLDNLYQYYQRPLDLNKATYEDLSALYVLSEKQIQRFFEYRNLSGSLVSLYELQAIPLFDPLTIQKLLPLVKVGNSRLITDTNHYVLLRYDQVLETRKGFTSLTKNPYQGHPYRMVTRYKGYAARDFSIGFTAKQDAGEPFVWNTSTHRYGVDFISAHAQIQNRGRLKNLSMGDYQLQIGQGLILAGGFYLGKGSEPVLTTRRSHLGARAYTSTTEYGFFRGASATVQLMPQLELTGFYSRIRRDANVINEDTVSSLQTSGLHRTDSEIADRGSLTSQDWGGHLRWVGGRGSVGITYLQTNYNKALQKASKLYNQYEFSGKQNAVLGINYSYLWRNLNVFGEAARSSSGGIGIITGVLASLSRRWDASMVFRKYDRNFHTFYGNAFAENSRNINEMGLYGGLKYTPNRRWQLGAYLDYFSFPWLRYLVDNPSQGFGTLARASYRPVKTITWTIQGFMEQKEKNVPTRLSKEKQTINTYRSGFSIGLDRPLSNRWSINSRAFYARFTYQGYSPSQGFALIQDVQTKLNRLTLTGRVAYFHTDDYDSRIYSYEQDVLYAFSIPAYSDQGLRSYLLVHYPLSRKLDAWLRLARTNLFNQPTIGSALDEIDHSHRTDLKVQIRWRW